MKRKNLEKFENERVQVSAKIERFGIASCGNEKLVSVLFSEVLVSNGIVTEKIEHVWYRVNKKVYPTCLDLTEHTYVKFTALVKPYFTAPAFEKVQGYCLRKVRHLQPSVQHPDGLTLAEFISFKEEQMGHKIKKLA